MIEQFLSSSPATRGFLWPVGKPQTTLHPCKLPVCSFRKRALFSFRVSWGTNFITPVSYKCHWDPAWPQFCTGAAFLHTERLTVQRLNSGVKKSSVSPLTSAEVPVVKISSLSPSWNGPVNKLLYKQIHVHLFFIDIFMHLFVLVQNVLEKQHC